MPRTRTLFTFCRLTLILFFFASLIPITWLALPSPILDADPSVYSTRILKAGETLTRVFETDAFFPTYLTNDHDYVTSDDDDDRCAFTSWTAPYFALHFAVDYAPSMGTAKTRVSHSTSVLNINNASISIDASYTTRQSSEQTVEVNAQVGDGDGIVLPWFPLADRVLLQHLVDPHARNATIPLRLRHFLHESESRRVLDVLPVKSTQPEDSHPSVKQVEEPLLRLMWTPTTSTGTDPAALLSNLTVEVPPSPIAGSPSRTYPIRKAMLTSMAPPILHLTNTYGHLITWTIEAIALAIYWSLMGGYIAALAFSVVWLFIGRPALETVLGWCNRVSGVRSVKVRRCCERLEVVRGEHTDEKGELAVWWIGRAVLGWDGERVVLEDGVWEGMEKEEGLEDEERSTGERPYFVGRGERKVDGERGV